MFGSFAVPYVADADGWDWNEVNISEIYKEVFDLDIDKIDDADIRQAIPNLKMQTFTSNTTTKDGAGCTFLFVAWPELEKMIRISKFNIFRLIDENEDDVALAYSIQYDNLLRILKNDFDKPSSELNQEVHRSADENLFEWLRGMYFDISNKDAAYARLNTFKGQIAPQSYEKVSKQLEQYYNRRTIERQKKKESWNTSRLDRPEMMVRALADTFNFNILVSPKAKINMKYTEAILSQKFFKVRGEILDQPASAPSGVYEIIAIAGDSGLLIETYTADLVDGGTSAGLAIAQSIMTGVQIIR